MAKDFAELKGQLAAAIRRDHYLSAAARVIGLEMMTWVRAPLSDPIFGKATDAGELCKQLGLGERTIRRAKTELARRGHFRFQRTGRADFAWAVGNADRSANLADQIGQIEQSSPGELPDQIGQLPQDRSANLADRNSKQSQKSRIAGMPPREVSNERSVASDRTGYGDRKDANASYLARREAEIAAEKDGGTGDGEIVQAAAGAGSR